MTLFIAVVISDGTAFVQTLLEVLKCELLVWIFSPRMVSNKGHLRQDLSALPLLSLIKCACFLFFNLIVSANTPSTVFLANIKRGIQGALLRCSQCVLLGQIGQT